MSGSRFLETKLNRNLCTKLDFFFFLLFAMHFVSELLHRHAEVTGLTESLREALENEWIPLPSNDRL